MRGVRLISDLLVLKLQARRVSLRNIWAEGMELSHKYFSDKPAIDESRHVMIRLRGL